MQGAFTELAKTFELTIAEFEASPSISRLKAGELGIKHYEAYLRETYFYTRENPQIQGLAAVYFRGHDRSMVRSFFKHATSEIGHDDLALSDLAALGVDVSELPSEYPLPNTIAFNAFPFYLIYNKNPISYLGYLYFLEFTPTSQGRSYIEAITALGVPENALTFLEEHATVDVHHNKMMESYAKTLIRDKIDLAGAQYAMKVAGRLYSQMLEGAFTWADTGRKNPGVDLEEWTRMSVHDNKALPSIARKL